MEYLQKHPVGDFKEAVSGIIQLASAKGLYKLPVKDIIIGGWDYRNDIPRGERENVIEQIRQLFWQLLVQGILIFGKDEYNGSFPDYRVTSKGFDILKNQPVYPYDPDKFSAFFRATNPNADPIIYEYFDEAVQAFNSDCLKSSFVMMGGASEKAILILHETFEKAITDPAKQTKYQKESGKMISTQFNILKNRLDLMVNSGKFPDKQLPQIIAHELPGAFQLIRRLRNQFGHPELYKPANADEAFITLRILPEYINKIYMLIDFFKLNPASW